jgi:hypothetical protein
MTTQPGDRSGHVGTGLWLVVGLASLAFHIRMFCAYPIPLSLSTRRMFNILRLSDSLSL